MSNRFLQESQFNNLATESTQLQIRDSLLGIVDVNVNGPVDISGNLTINDISANIINLVDCSCNITNTVNTNQVSIQGQNISLGNGIVNDGVQRVVLCTDQPIIDVSANITNLVDCSCNVTNTVGTNLAQVNGVTVLANNGLASGGCQRVVLANNQDTTNWGSINTNVLNDVSANIINVVDCSCNVTNTVGTNLTQVNGNTIQVATGSSNTGCQRVVLVSDQSTDQWDNVRVIPVNQRNNLTSVEFINTIVSGTGTAAQLIYYGGAALVTDVGNPSINTNLFIPTSNTTAYIKSTSANDTSAGSKLQTVLAEYYSSDGTLHSRTVNLSGTTGSDITLGNADFFRVKDIRPTVMGTLDNFNSGVIRINNNATAGMGLDYPGSMSPNSNKWYSSFIHLPNHLSGYAGTTNLDKIQYGYWQDSGGTLYETNIRIYSRINIGGTLYPWQIQNYFVLENNTQFEVDLKDISFPPNSWVDLAYTAQLTGSTNTTISGKLSYHTE